MEEHDRIKPGGSSQDSGCCPLLVPESQEYELERILQESASHLERIPIPDPKPPALPISDLGQPRKSPLTGTDKKYPLMKQRGFYSDILSPGTLDNLGNVCCGPYMSQNLIRKADLDKFTPKADSFKIPEDFQELVEQQSIGATTRLLTQTDFPLQAYEPKVQVPFQVLPGQCPRKTEIERRKRQYLSLDIEQLLANEDIDSNKLMPRHPDLQHPQTIEQGHDPLFPIYLPLKSREPTSSSETLGTLGLSLGWLG